MEVPKLSADELEQVMGEGILSLKGKDYLQVAHRVVHFRQKNPNATIFTEVERVGDFCFVKATIAENYDIRATAYKEVKFGSGKNAAKEYPLECAETGAIGRALALCGYGTLTGDLVEEDQLADSPLLKGNK